MEVSFCFCFCFCVVTVSVLTLLWGLKRSGGATLWTVGAPVGVLGAALCLPVPPVVCGVVVVCFILICVTKTRDELLTEGRAVLITGCDSGFGLALAERLGLMGLTVFAGVLDVNGGGAQHLRGRGCEHLKVLQLDVTDEAQVEAARRYVCSQLTDTGLWGLVNNAGVLECPADAELQPIRAYRRCVDVNFLAAVRMCQVFLPLLRRSRGRIVNVSSMAGEVPMPMFAAYGASKAAQRVFSAVMRLEVSPWGVQVSSVQPAGFRTNIFGSSDDVARLRDELLAAASPEAREDYGAAYISSLPHSLTRMSRQSAEDLTPVVDDMCHALLSRRPRPVYTPGTMGWLLPFLHRCCPPAAFDAIVTKLVRHTDRRPAALSRS